MRSFKQLRGILEKTLLEIVPDCLRESAMNEIVVVLAARRSLAGAVRH
jgi:hypothetical protein